MRFILGITGGIGSGKSAATQWFESQGIRVIDADVVAREIVEPGQRYRKFNSYLATGCYWKMVI